MKPIISAGKAYFCFILSGAGIIILPVIGYLFKIKHESMMGSINDPEDGDVVSSMIFKASLIYLGFFTFCGLQIFSIKKEKKMD